MTIKNNKEGGEVKKMIRPDVCGVEVNLIYLMTGSITLFLSDIERRLRLQGSGFRHEKKRLFTEICSHVKAIRTLDDKLHDDVCDNVRDWRQYDQWLADTNELCRLMLNYAEHCSEFEGLADRVCEYMSGLPSVGIVTREDIDRFHLK